MKIETWEEACQYLWQNSYGTTIELTIEEDIVYFTIGEETGKHYWLRARDHNPLSILKQWEIAGDNPNYIPPLTIQEKVCKKISVMEQRFQRYKQRKQHGE